MKVSEELALLRSAGSWRARFSTTCLSVCYSVGQGPVGTPGRAVWPRHRGVWPRHLGLQGLPPWALFANPPRHLIALITLTINNYSSPYKAFSDEEKVRGQEHGTRRTCPRAAAPSVSTEMTARVHRQHIA